MSWLPSLNAGLNILSALFLIAGYLFIRRKDIFHHRFCMVGALISSSFFLIGYLTYHYVHGTTKFTGTGWIRTAYFTILVSHTILAAAVLPLVIVTLRRALKGEFEKHRRMAKITWPVWLYVSVTGVVIYVMLYHMKFS